MKKKYFLYIVLLFLIFLVGCDKNSESGIVKKIKNNLNDMESYYLSGDLTIHNNEDKYNYDVEVFFRKDDYYRVNLINQLNNHTQIILKNDDGVYVVTPSLNKSFKFQSNWPNDSSQIYLINSLYNDIYNSEERIFKNLGDGYTFEIEANYPNNSNLVKQVINFDKNLNLKSVEIYDDNNTLQMSMTFSSIEINDEINDEIFNLNNIISDTGVGIKDENEKHDQKESDSDDVNVSSINDIIYPLYIPSGTVLIEEEKVAKTDGERIILTFDGEKPFILVEETVSIEEEFSIIPTYGEPYLLIDTVATLSDNSISWISDGIEYYLVSDVMSQIELVEIASSVTTIDSDK